MDVACRPLNCPSKTLEEIVEIRNASLGNKSKAPNLQHNGTRMIGEGGSKQKGFKAGSGSNRKRSKQQWKRN
eukprot:754882-Hanusia_phi.AAC.1